MAGTNLTQIEGRIRRVQIDSARMNLRQRRIFEVYLAMGDERTLEKLYGYCRDEGIIASYRTLQRWSTEFAWQGLVQQIEEHLALELGRLLLPDHVERVRGDLMRIQRMKLKLYAKIDADEIDITIDDYIKLLKIEDMLTSKPLERPGSDEITGKFKVEIELTQEELAIALAISAKNKHRLPPPRLVNPSIDADQDTIDQ